MKVNVIIGDAVWELISCYSLQTGGCATEKEEFHELKDRFATSVKVLVWEGHVVCDVGIFGEVHSGFGDGLS